jgi:hypothetical protein
VDATARRAELYRKEAGEVLYEAFAEGAVPLPCLGDALPLEAVYAGVELEARPG